MAETSVIAVTGEIAVSYPYVGRTLLSAKCWDKLLT